eukprot:Transcript_7083.p3 GENE.Transcript_7083~~Transcript_7083.p3  ORF type:complete len:165 (-),score=1.13 Transcript_7083:472-966(-)
MRDKVHWTYVQVAGNEHKLADVCDALPSRTFGKIERSDQIAVTVCSTPRIFGSRSAPLRSDEGAVGIQVTPEALGSGATATVLFCKANGAVLRRTPVESLHEAPEHCRSTIDLGELGLGGQSSKRTAQMRCRRRHLDPDVVVRLADQGDLRPGLDSASPPEDER